MLRIVLFAIMATAIAACSEKSLNPLSPNIAGPIEGVEISAPTDPAAVEGQLVPTDEQPVTLTFATATSNSERPFWYEVEVATDQGFGNIVHRSGRIEPVQSSQAAAQQMARSSLNTASGTQSYAVPDTLRDGMYYWHVRAADGANTGPFSDTAQFEIFTPLSIPAPAMVSPVDDAVIGSTQPSLKARTAEISGPAREVSYRFEVATDTAFNDVVAVVTVDPGGQTTSATPGALSWNTRYRWRVRASATGREGRVHGPWSATRTFKTPQVPILQPVPISPVNGVTTATSQPTLVVQNNRRSSTGAVTIFIQIARNTSFNTLVAAFNVPQSSGAQTSAMVPHALAPEALYFWRVRAADGSFNTGFGPHASFRTPAAPVAPPPPPSGGGGGGSTGPPPPGGCCPPPNRLEVVKAVARDTGYPHSGISVNDFTQRVAERLAREDPRWGRYINNNGNLGKDTVSYRVDGDTNPFKIDIVGGAGTSNPNPHWDEHGRGGGRWKPVR